MERSQRGILYRMSLCFHLVYPSDAIERLVFGHPQGTDCSYHILYNVVCGCDGGMQGQNSIRPCDGRGSELLALVKDCEVLVKKIRRIFIDYAEDNSTKTMRTRSSTKEARGRS